MRNRIVAGALVAAGLALAARSTPEGPRVVFVDLWKLVREAKQARLENDLVKKWQDAQQLLLDERMKIMKEHQAELDPLKPGSDEWMQKTKELKLEKAAWDAELDSLEEQLARRQARAQTDSYARASAACNAYLEQHDADAVVQCTTEPFHGRKPSDTSLEVAVRSVVAYRKSLDVTDAVLAILDAGK